MADYKLTQSGAAVQAAINRAIVAAVTEEVTTEEYNALASKDPKTLYIITDDETEEELERRVAALEEQLGDTSAALAEMDEVIG